MCTRTLQPPSWGSANINKTWPLPSMGSQSNVVSFTLDAWESLPGGWCWAEFWSQDLSQREDVPCPPYTQGGDYGIWQILAKPDLVGEKIWKWRLFTLVHYHSFSNSNSNSCWHLLGTYYVPGTALNLLHVLTHIIFTALYKVGTITIPIPSMGEMSHREAN